MRRNCASPAEFGARSSAAINASFFRESQFMNALIRSSVAAVLACLAAAAFAQTYPAKPAHIVVPFPPSGAEGPWTALIATPASAQA